MMEVNQPIGTNALELSKMNKSLSESEGLKDAETVKQNGTSKLLEPDGEINEFDVEDAMEQLMYSDSEDVACESKKPTVPPVEETSESELVQNISTNLVEDIIQLNKDTKRANDENGTHEDTGEESSEMPPSSVKSPEQSGPEEDDAKTICATGEDTLTEVEIPESISDIDLEANECVLLEEDDTDENLLLASGKDEEDSSLQNSAIQIEDSVVNVASTEATLDELTDNSIAAIDESGLSILNTAAVDIADMTVDDSVKSVDELTTVEVDSSAGGKEPAVFALMEEMVTSMADNLKDEEKIETLPIKTADDIQTKSQLSAEIEDLIKFQDVDMVEAQTESNGDIAEQPKTDSDESIIVKLSDETTTASEETLKDSEPEVSDLIKFDSVVGVVEEEKPIEEETKTVHSDLMKLPTESVAESDAGKDDSANKKQISEELSVVSPEESSVKASTDPDQEKLISESESNDKEDKSDSLKSGDDACPQALQAADEEDLLEMMDEPELIDPDEDNLEDGDDNSSESGSAKRSQEGEGDDEDEDSESVYAAVDDDESSRNAGDDAVDVQTEEAEPAEGEPPIKKRCSVDVRETVEVESSNESSEFAAKKPKESVEQPEQKEPEEKTISKETNDIEKDGEVVNDEKVEKKTAEPAEALEKPVASEEAAKKDDQPESMDVSETESVSDKKAEDDSKKEVVSADTEKSESDKKVDESETMVIEPEKKASVEAEEVTNAPENVEKSEDTGSQNKIAPKVADQDEVLVIDDDDDVPVKEEKSAPSEEKKTEEERVVVGKRPCPEDNSETKEESSSVKKIRLSTEKMEESEEKTKDEVKATPEPVEPLKVNLTPEPETTKEKKPVRLDFMNKFLKPLERMNRSDLEEFVLQKIVEGIAFKSSIAEMRTQLDAQDTLLQGYRQKVHDLKKQFKDLEMVHERVVKDLEKKNQHFITPVKITRAVGLQVSQPRFVTGNRTSTSGNTSGNTTPKAVVSRSPAITPGSSPNKNTPPTNTQTRRLTYTRVPPLVVNAKTSVQQSVVNRIGTTTIISKTVSSTVNKSVTSVQSQVSSVTANSSQQQLPTASTSPSAIAGTAALRKKPLQKFTPMRPPLSITQQVQQQQQTRQMQEQLVRQQIQEVQTSGSVSGGSQPQSPLTQSPQGSPLTRTPEPTPTPAGISPARVPPIVMKKVTPQAKGTAGTMQIINRQTPSMVSAATATTVRSSTTSSVTTVASVVTIDNSLIDLTDEDDVPKTVVPVSSAPVSTVVPRPPITLLNGQQQQYVQRQTNTMPPLVVINQQRMVTRPTLQQRPPTASMVNGSGASTRPMLMQRPANVTNGIQRALTYKPRMLNGQIDPNRRLVARAPIRQPAANFVHPAPLPQPGAQPSNGAWKHAPPRPSIRINNIETGIVISWTMDDLSDNHATIVSYQIYAYQETAAPPSIDMWRHVGDVKAMLLPMAVTLTQFQEGQRYHFAVRAVDEHQRVGQFSPPRTWNESAPGKA